jgi:Holliday junction resolvasome RuvABC endonuclease subunit
MILAFDLGITNTNPSALALIDVEAKKLVYFESVQYSKTGDWLERLIVLAKWVDEKISEYKDQIECMAYELPYVMPKNMQTSIKLSHAGGIILGCAAKYNVKCYPITPNEAKKALTGKGNSDKETMIKFAGDWLKVPVELSSHVADAVGVALAASSK